MGQAKSKGTTMKSLSTRDVMFGHLSDKEWLHRCYPLMPEDVFEHAFAAFEIARRDLPALLPKFEKEFYLGARRRKPSHHIDDVVKYSDRLMRQFGGMIEMHRVGKLSSAHTKTLLTL